MGVNLGNIEESEARDSQREDQRNNGSFLGLLRREIISDLFKKLVVISHACIPRLSRALVEVYLKGTQLLLKCVNGSWVLNMQVEFVVAVDLLRHELA